ASVPVAGSSNAHTPGSTASAASSLAGRNAPTPTSQCSTSPAGSSPGGPPTGDAYRNRLQADVSYMVVADLRSRDLAPRALEQCLPGVPENLRCDRPSSAVTSTTPRLGGSPRSALSSSTARATNCTSVATCTKRSGVTDSCDADSTL